MTNETLAANAAKANAKKNGNGKAKEEKTPTLWTMGRFQNKKFVLIKSSTDHNALEALSAFVNREAKTRAAFVVDSAHVGVAKGALLEEDPMFTGQTALDTEDEGEDEGEGE